LDSVKYSVFREADFITRAKEHKDSPKFILECLIPIINLVHQANSSSVCTSDSNFLRQNFTLACFQKQTLG